MIEALSESREPLIFTDLECFSVGKNPPRNEDIVAYNDRTLVLCDGASDKTGFSYEGKSGGELAAQVATEVCLQSEAFGPELVDAVTEQVRSLYERINPSALTHSEHRFAATLLAAKVVGDKLQVTQVGDTAFRVNGTETYTNGMLIDALVANTRKQYIEATQDVEGSRDFIMPLLKAQHRYQNNPDSPLGYGVIDGTPVPSAFVRTYTFEAAAVHTLELVSDGYYGKFPAAPTISEYEAMYAHIEEVDPNKCGEYPATKLSDDRTVLIARLTPLATPA